MDLGTKLEKCNDSNFLSFIEKTKKVLTLALKGPDDFLEDDPPADKFEVPKWVKNDRKARAGIWIFRSDEHREDVRDVDTAKEIWQALHNFSIITIY